MTATVAFWVLLWIVSSLCIGLIDYGFGRDWISPSITTMLIVNVIAIAASILALVKLVSLLIKRKRLGFGFRASE
jgi:hypothetical protein